MNGVVEHSCCAQCSRRWREPSSLARHTSAGPIDTHPSRAPPPPRHGSLAKRVFERHPKTGEGAPPVPGVSRTGASQQDPGSQTSTDPAGRGADAPPDHAGPQADVAGLPDPDAGPRPDAAGRGAGRRMTSPDPGRIPAGTAGPGPSFGPGAGGAAYGSFGRGGGDSPFTTRRLEGEGWRRVTGSRR